MVKNLEIVNFVKKYNGETFGFRDLLSKVEYINEKIIFSHFFLDIIDIYVEFLEKFELNDLFKHIIYVIQNYSFESEEIDGYFDKFLFALETVLQRVEYSFCNKKIINFYCNLFICSCFPGARFDKVLNVFNKYIGQMKLNLQEIILNEFIIEFVKQNGKLSIPNEFCNELKRISQYPFLYELPKNCFT
jgi:hypothetical protein